jgi:TPP-dependent pyruvate/acetoin dehydrogenase alpha subunit
MQLSRDELEHAYRLMRRIRVFEERVHDEFEAGRIPGFVHLYAGQEASAVGVCMQLADEDCVESTHRGHGHCLAKGSSPTGMMLEIFGRAGGLCQGKGGSMHVADPDRGVMGANSIVGAAVPLAVGVALAAKTLKKKNVAVAFCGDGGSNQGGVFESLNLAAVWKLPVIFVFENNGYAETTASGWAVACGDIVKRASAFAMPGIQVDGFDFFAVHQAAREAIERAREGAGPTLIEVKLGRFFGHHEGDTQTYRGKDEVAVLRRDHDCLRIFRDKVIQASLLEDGRLDEIDRTVAAEVDAAVAAAIAGAPPTAAALHENVYARY